MKKILVDTNTLLDLFEIDPENKYILLSHVNRELDKHKVYGDSELKYKTRRAVRFIEDNIDSFELDIRDYQVSFNQDADNDYTDNKIIQACLDNSYSLMTDDLLLKQKARAYGIEIISKSVLREYDYKGILQVYIDEAEQAAFYENPTINRFDLYINQYIVIHDTSGEYIDTYKWNGNVHKKLIRSEDKRIKAKNKLQECAIDLLLDKTVPIKIIAGTYGSGKTILSVKTALHNVLSRGCYSKIMMVRNPIGSGKEIGYLKGTKEDKTEGFFKPFIQHLNRGEQQAFELEQRGVLTKEIPFYMKGLSIDDTLILCDEAEDLDVKLIRLIGTRLGDNSAVVFSGDYNQVENEYKNNNGLMLAIEKLKGNPLVGIVVLNEDVRSEASKVFAELEF